MYGRTNGLFLLVNYNLEGSGGYTLDKMHPCTEEEQTADHLIFQCKKLRNHRNAMIKQIKKNNGGNWPTSNETLVSNYLQVFVTSVKSIDFRDLQRRFTIKDR